MSGFEWRRAPIGHDASRWVTAGGRHTVLVAIDTVGAGRRLLDVVRLVESDPRIEVVCTAASDTYDTEVEWLLRDSGVIVVPWREATRHEFALAIAGGFRAIGQVRAPLIVLPHRAGSAVQARRSRECLAAGSADGSGRRWANVGGFSAVPHAIAVSHQADWAWLSRACPEVLSSVTVVGDSSYDRIAASLRLRDFYRRALGVGPDQKLVVASFARGQWSPPTTRLHSVLCRLLTELPSHEYRVLSLSDPDDWIGRAERLARPVQRGFSLLPPDADWRAPLVAADWVVGDDCSVLPYAAIAGTPVLLTSATAGDVDSHLGFAELARIAPRLSVHRSLRAQFLEAAGAQEHQPDRYREVLERITSEPGRFNRNVRRLVCRLLGLRQPATIPTADPVSPPIRID